MFLEGWIKYHVLEYTVAMREFQAKRRFERILYSTGSILVILLIIGFLAKATYGAYQKKVISQKELDLTMQAYNHLTTEQQNLKGDLAFLKTDEGIDAELRSKYRLVRPGENVVVIVEEQNDEQETAAAKQHEDESGNTLHASSSDSWSFVNFFKKLFR